jgi:hypothetical protein
MCDHTTFNYTVYSLQKNHFNRSVPLSHQGNILPRVILPRVILLCVILLIVVVQTFEVPLRGN